MKTNNTKKALLILYLFIFSYCTNKECNSIKKNVICKSERVVNNYSVKSDSIINKSFKLVIKSYPLSVEIDTVLLFKDAKIKQELVFFYEDKIIKKTLFPIKMISVKTDSKTIKIQEDNIYEISVVRGKKDWFYKISGRGTFSNQSEIYSIYSSNGILLWYSHSIHRSINDEFSSCTLPLYDNLDDVLNSFGMFDVNFNKPSNTVEIDKVHPDNLPAELSVH